MAWRVFIATFSGIALAVATNRLTEYFTGDHHRPVQETAKASEGGHATNILSGLGVGFESSAFAIMRIAVVIYMSSVLADKKREGYNFIVVDDVRFTNEYNYIKKMGGKVYRIEAKDRTLMKLRKETNNDQEKINKIMNHESETMLDDYKFDKIIDNSIMGKSTNSTSSE